MPLVLLPIAACAPGTSGLQLTIKSNGNIDGITSFVLTVENRGDSKRTDFKISGDPISLPPPRTLALTFDKDRKGAVDIIVEALGAGDRVLGRGKASGRIDPSQITELTVVIESGGTPDDMASGDGGDGGQDIAQPDMAKECVADPDCKDAKKPRCHLPEMGINRCVECLASDDNCVGGRVCVNLQCKMGCKNSSDCKVDGGGHRPPAAEWPAPTYRTTR